MHTALRAAAGYAATTAGIAAAYIATALAAAIALARRCPCECSR